MLHVERKGQGTPLVFIHGFLANCEIWQEQIEFFSKTHEVITIDLAGFGKSAAITAPDSIAGFAQMIFDRLDEIGINEFALLGHSMGGMVVQQMAFMAPHRISKLICYGTGPRGVLPERFETIEQSRTRLKRDGLNAMSKQIAATWFMKKEQDPKYQLCLEMASKATEQAADACFTAWQNWDGREQLQSISAKSLIIWGEYDRSYGWPQIELLWKGIKDCSLAVVPNCSHNVHLENPKFFNLIVKDFLALK